MKRSAEFAEVKLLDRLAAALSCAFNPHLHAYPICEVAVDTMTRREPYVERIHLTRRQRGATTPIHPQVGSRQRPPPTNKELDLGDRRVGNVRRIYRKTRAASPALIPTTPVKVLDQHIRHFRRNFNPITASQLPGAASLRDRGCRTLIVVTFDDDHSCYVRLALPVLRRNNVPATLFLNGSEPRWFPWEYVRGAWNTGQLHRVLNRAGYARSPLSEQFYFVNSCGGQLAVAALTRVAGRHQ
jgi:hypothetical protein